MLPVWKNLGFLLYVILYFTQTKSLNTWPEENLTSVIFKILPMFHIILIIVSTMSETNVKRTKSASTYQWTIAVGLFFSSLGDIALVYRNDYFIIGLGFFAIAQATYIKAFGLRPIGNGPAAATFGVLAVSFYAYLYGGMANEEGVVKAGTVVYAVLIFTMVWRATARLMHRPSIPRLLGAAGAMSFVASDFMLAIERWRGGFFRAPMWVMITYYAAQLLIGLSACDDEEFKDDDEESEDIKVKNGSVASEKRDVKTVKSQ